LQKCIDSFKDEYDELIVVHSEGRTYAQNINRGLKQAKGDFLIVCSDDVTLRSGHPWQLCHDGEVHSPVTHGGINKTFHGQMFCLPRDVYEKIGGYDETCPSPYSTDSDYWIRLLKAGIPVVMNESVHIDHPEPGRTLKHTGDTQGDAREWFINKHGKGYLRIVE